ncbi:hypothetical protein BD311DRAFT_724906 [Dichomitus squalens]|uniref:Uncharacterized protein n=1 Tax=Dichomitus squalens TaxID=114155 RepID=A0A4Q9MI27_9APHY|nr:hypothetical protein BD311DRAFT_724906 [Dichomitus squalens]
MPEAEISDQHVFALLEEGQPLSDLLKELIGLRNWKEQQLEAQRLEALRMERMLSRICVNCKETASRWIRHQVGTTDDLPVELLHTIFRYTIPPNALLDPIATRGSCTPWIQAIAAKMTLARVSRRWHSATLPFLYEEVSFRHPTQVRSFASTLRTHPNICRLVRKIVVDCPATKEIRDLVVGDLIYILTQCTELRALAFTDSLFAMEDDLRRVALYAFPTALTAAIRALSRTLVRFEQWPQGGTPHFTWPIACVSPAPLLTTLTINIDHDESLKSVELAALEELDISCQYVVPRGSDHSQRFANWRLPRLKRLIMPMAIDNQGRLLQQFGRSITYLEFRDHLDMATRWHKTPWRPYVDYIHLCPILQHLVFQEYDTSVLDLLPSHPTLTYVDIWFNSPAGHIRQDFLERCRQRRSASDLRWNVRLLDRSLNAVRQLPELFPPGVPEEELPSIHAIPGLSITHTAWGVYRSDLDILYPPEDSLEEAVSENSSSDSDSTYSSESDPSEDDSVTESEGEMLEEDEIAALASI